jgi:GntR family transcriptional regulator of arabinose operon
MKQVPKYKKIVHWTLEQLVSGSIIPGDKFSSENALCQQFNVSRQTVRRALEELESNGYITRIKGSGTYISKSPPHNSTQVKSKGDSSKSIGIITTYLDAYIFPSIMQAIESELSQEGYTVQVASTHNTVEGERRALQSMLDNRLDGLIVWPTKSGLPCLNLQYYAQLINKGLPIIFVDSFYPELSGTYVAIDDISVGRLATSHLIQSGHKKILGIFPHGDRQGQLRYKGYCMAMNEAGIPLIDTHVHWYSKEDVEEELSRKSLWQNIAGSTAAFCFNDSLALMLMDQLDQRDIFVPTAFSVIGVDNTMMGKRSGLTSIVHPSEELGHTVAHQLISMIEGNETQNVLFPPKLIQRKTVRQFSQNKS